MIAMIALPTLAIYVVVIGLMMVHLRKEARAEVEIEMTRLAGNYAARFDGAFREAAAVATATARLVETAPDLSPEQLFKQLRANTELNPLVYGSAIAFEPGAFKDGDTLFCPYVYRGPDGLAEMDITREVLDWYGDDKWQWWHLPKRTGAALWTDPYFDDGAGDALMVTWSAPFFRDGQFRGVATVDIRLSTLQEQIGDQIVSERDFAILTRNGRYVYSTVQTEIMDRTVFELAEELGRPDMAAVARRMVSGQTGVATLEAWQQLEGTQWVFYAPIPSTGWTFASVIPERVALAGMRRRMTQASLALGATLLLIIGSIFYVSGRITRPITKLQSSVRQIAEGDLDVRVEGITTRDEIGDLADDFNRMTSQLKDHVQRLGRARAASRDAVIFAMAKLAESRDTDTGKHLERICRYVAILSGELVKHRTDIDQTWVETVTLTAALHDIGKVGIPDAVLCKPGKLTDEERKIIQTHTTIGGDTLIALKQRVADDDQFLGTATEIAFAHHEKWDGSGYPFGLSKEDISLAARLTAVADVYDALTCERVYKKPMSHDKARAIIVGDSGSHFDPAIVEAFVATEDQFRAVSDELQG
jgi:response regulator RpfG family c-di-GMP phosphodiesterase